MLFIKIIISAFLKIFFGVIELYLHFISVFLELSAFSDELYLILEVWSCLANLKHFLYFFYSL